MQELPRTGRNSLTRTELAVAELVAADLNGAEVAHGVYLPERTVKTRVSHVTATLGPRSRIEHADVIAHRPSH